MPKTRLISPGSIPNHRLLKNLQLNGNYLSNDGEDEGISINDAGLVAITTVIPDGVGFAGHKVQTQYQGTSGSLMSCQHINLQVTGAVADGETITASGLDVDCIASAATGTTVGSVYLVGLDVDVVGEIHGTQTTIGLDVIAYAADTNYGATIRSSHRQLRLLYDGSSYLDITVASGSHTTIATAESGNLILDAAGTLLLDSVGVLELNSSGGAINIGDDDDDYDINIGTDGNRDIIIGNEVAGTSVTLDAFGTSRILISSPGIDIDGSTVHLQSTNALTLTDGTATFKLAGIGQTTLTAATTVDLDCTGNMALNSSGGTIGIGNDDNDYNINIGTAGTRTLNVGINDGTDLTTIAVNGPVTIDRNNTATANSTTVGLVIDYDSTGDAGASQTINNTSLYIDLNSAASTNHGTSIIKDIGIDIDIVGGTDGTNNIATGIDINVSGSDSNLGMLITNTSPGAYGGHLKLAYDLAGYAIFKVADNGVLTIATTDSIGNTDANLILDIDGDINFDASGGDFSFTVDTAIKATLDSSGNFLVAGTLASRGHIVELGTVGNTTATTISTITNTSTTAGKNLEISAGSGLVSGSADVSGGDLILASGSGDGTGTSTIQFQTKVSGTDAVAERMRINTDGKVNIAGLTASEIVITDGSKNLVSAAVATYPSLAQLAHVKGVTSAIQAQLDAALPKAGGTMTGDITTISDIVSTGITIDDSQDITLDAAGGDVHILQADLHIPVDKKVIFGDPGEYIAGDDTSLHIQSGGYITMNPASGLLAIYSGSSATIRIAPSGGAGTAGPSMFFHSILEPDDYFEIDSSTNGATILSTVDDVGNEADLTLDIDGFIDMNSASGEDITLDSGGDITLDADGADINLADDGTTWAKFSSANSQIILYENAGASTDDFLRIRCAANGATSIATVDNSGTDASLTLDIDGGIILDSATGVFEMKGAGTVPKFADMYAGMILGYTTVGINATAAAHTLVAATMTVLDDAMKVKFIAPPSGVVEIFVSIYGDYSRRVPVFGLSDQNTGDTYRAISFPDAEDVTNEHSLRLPPSSGGDTLLINRWVVTDLTAGTAYEWWFAAKTSIGAGGVLRWGGTATNQYPPFIMKATALPAAVTDFAVYG